MAGTWAAPQQWGVEAVHMCHLHTGKVLVFSGNLGCYLWDPVTNTFSVRPPPRPNQPPQQKDDIFCSGHCQLADGRVLVAGGKLGMDDGYGSRLLDIFDPVTEEWQTGSSRPPAMARARWYPTCTLLANG